MNKDDGPYIYIQLHLKLHVNIQLVFWKGLPILYTDFILFICLLNYLFYLGGGGYFLRINLN